jgi:hypothetical protein
MQWTLHGPRRCHNVTETKAVKANRVTRPSLDKENSSVL